MVKCLVQRVSNRPGRPCAPRNAVANTVDLTELESPKRDLDSCASVCVPVALLL